MSNDEDWEKKEENRDSREESRVSWELNDIRDELKFDLDEMYDELEEEIEAIKEDAEDIKEDLKEDLEDLIEEREELLDEVGEIKDELGSYEENAIDQIEHAKEKLERLKEKIERHQEKFEEKVFKKVEKAKKKAARINISVDEDMSEEWKDWAEGLGASVSELVRKSMKFVKNNIGDIAKLEHLGRELEGVGLDIEQAVKNSGIEKIGRKLEKELGRKKIKPKIKLATITDDVNKERIMKRVSGLVKLHKSLPIDKLAQALNETKEFAENLVYELAAEGIEGELEEGVFKFTNTAEEVISKLNELIDKK
ncbi:MAG: hypothetical protein ACFE8B_04990 [Candidatus Hermodarchaeota archaeon]